MAEITPEMALLLQCARPSVKPHDMARVSSLLHAELNWEQILQMAVQHRVLPLLYRYLQENGLNQIPSESLRHLQSLYYKQVMRNHRLTKLLHHLLAILDDQGIRAIPLKGPVLAVMAYDDLCLRSFTDIDLLVPEAQLFQAKELICAQGYWSALGLLTSETVFRRTRHAYNLFPLEKGRGAVDLHWAITKRHFAFPLDTAQLWDRLVTIDVTGTSTHSLPPEETLLLTCVHSTVHYWAELGWISDVAALVERHTALEWSRLLSQTRALHSERMLLLGLNLAHELLGTPLPPNVAEQIRATPIIGKLTLQVLNWVCTNTPSRYQTAALYGLPAWTMGRYRDRVRYWQHLFKRGFKKYLIKEPWRRLRTLSNTWSTSWLVTRSKG